MKQRILNTYLAKGANAEDEVTIAINNSEKDFKILGVSNSVGKKILIVELIEKEEDILVGSSVDDKQVKIPFTEPKVEEVTSKEVSATTDSSTVSGEITGQTTPDTSGELAPTVTETKTQE